MLKFAPVAVFTYLTLSACSLLDAFKGTDFDPCARSLNANLNISSNRCHIEIPRACVNVCDTYICLALKSSRLFNPYNSPRIPFLFSCSTNKKVKNYVRRTMGYIRRSVKSEIYESIKCDAFAILNCINDHLDGTPKEFALFTASALHNTSYFQYLVSNVCNDKYKPRGILMINNVENYEILSKLSGKKFNYLTKPDFLSKPTKANIVNTIKFWKKIMRNRTRNFSGMMDALNTVSWGTYKHSNKTCKPEDLKVRENIYNDLLKLYKK